MKRICMLLLACLLLPTAALAVTEGVVESAPEVIVALPKTQENGMLEAAYWDTVQRLVPEAIAATVFLQGSPDDIELTHASAPVWYSPAQIRIDGSVHYDIDVRKGVELIFERKGTAVSRRIRAMFDLETEQLVLLQQKLNMKSLSERLHSGNVMDDEMAMKMAQMSLEESPGCEQIEMSLSSKSDGRYAIVYGKTAHGWHVEVMVDRAAHAVVTNEWISDEHSVAFAKMRK